MSSKGFIRSGSDRCQDVLEFPSEHPEFQPRALPFRLMPGVFAGQLYPARENVGGVMLPSSGGGWESEGAAAERVRPDCVTVLAVGKLKGPGTRDEGPRDTAPAGWNAGTARREAAALLECTLEPGDRVMVRPWSGIRFQNAYGVRGLCFFGQTDGWQEDAVMRWVDGQWRPLDNWVTVQLDRAFQSLGVISSRTILDVKGTVLDAGPRASLRPGDRVVTADDQAQQSDDDMKWLTTKWGPWGDDVWLVREVDCEGVRRVVATIV